MDGPRKKTADSQARGAESTSTTKILSQGLSAHVAGKNNEQNERRAVEMRVQQPAEEAGDGASNPATLTPQEPAEEQGGKVLSLNDLKEYNYIYIMIITWKNKLL